MIRQRTVSGILAAMTVLVTMSVSGAQSLTPQELKTRIDAGETIIILDIRSAAVYAAGHLTDAKNVGFDGSDLAAGYQTLIGSKTATVVVVCQDGTDSPDAVSSLISAGYSSSLFVQGGMDACNTVLSITASAENLTTWGVIKTLFGGQSYRRKQS